MQLGAKAIITVYVEISRGQYFADLTGSKNPKTNFSWGFKFLILRPSAKYCPCENFIIELIIHIHMHMAHNVVCLR